MATEVADDMAGSGQPRAAILLIVGEPFSDSSKQLIVDEIVKGLEGWDSEATGVDINSELTQIANRADLGEERAHDKKKPGERVIRHASDRATVDVLINPHSQTVKDALRAVLTQLSPFKAVIYAGYAFHGTAGWVLQDELFTFTNFTQVFKDTNVENALKQTEGARLMLHTLCGGEWAMALKGWEGQRLLPVTLNPAPKQDHSSGLVQFSAYVSNLIRVAPLTSLLQASDVIGNISFSRPVLYIFPGYHGDAALFGMKGFNMLVDGGFSRRSCFWDFVRHLDGIDALLLTHLGPDNLFGIKALLERKIMDSIHPDIDYMYMNVSKTGVKAIANGDTNHSELVINLAAEGSALLDLSRKLGHAPHPLTRPLSSSLEPVNLFHKIGKGSLDMYVLNPVSDAKETKEFLSQWGKQAASFGQVNGIPLPNCTSICALLVVRPASTTERVTRILFPGTAPQHKLLEGLERVKHLEFLKHPTFCTHDLHKAKKAAIANGRASSVTRKPISMATPRPVVTTKAEPPKRLETKASSSRVSMASPPSAKSSKLQKDSSNKRVSGVKKDKDKVKDKVKRDEKEKEDKSKSSTSSSPSKASIKTASPIKTPSPALTPASSSPNEQPESAGQTQSLAPTSAGDCQASPVTPDNNLDQHIVSTTTAGLMTQAPAEGQPMPADDNRLAVSPDNNGTNITFGHQQPAEPAMAEREKLRELGVYDDDDDEGVDNCYDEKENGGMFGVRDFPGEEIQPQALPEPVAVVDTPTSSEPDLIQDTFPKQSLMEQSQIFEDGIEPDYGAEADGSVPEPLTDSTLERQAVSSVSMSQPPPEDLMMTHLPSEAACPVEEPQVADTSLAEQSSLHADQQAVEPSPVSEPLAEDSLLAPESGEEKSTSLVAESAVDESLLVESHMEKSSPQDSEPLTQEPKDDLLLADVTESAPPVSAAEQDEYKHHESSDYLQEPRDDAAPGGFKEEISPAVSDDEEEPAPSSGLDHLKETNPFVEEQLLSATEPALEQQAPVYDHGRDDDEGMEADQTTEPALEQQAPVCDRVYDDDEGMEAVQTTEPALEQQAPVYDHGRDDDEGMEAVQTAEPALEQQVPVYDHGRDDDEGIEAVQTAEPALEQQAPVYDHGRDDDEGMEAVQTTEPALEQQAPVYDHGRDDDEGMEAVQTTEPALEQQVPVYDRGYDDDEGMEADQTTASLCHSSAEGSGQGDLSLDDRLHDTSPGHEEQSYSSHPRDASPIPLQSDFDENVKECASAHEEASFEDSLKEASPVTDEAGISEKWREASPVREEPDSYCHADLAPQDPSFAEDLRETSSVPEELGFHDDKETEDIATPEEHGFGDVEEKEERPAPEEPGLDDEREGRIAVEEPGLGNKEEPGLDDDKEREDHVAMEEPGFDDDKEREDHVAMEEPGLDDYKEREDHVAMEEPGFDDDKEREDHVAMEEPGFDDDKEREDHVAMEEPGLDDDKEREDHVAMEEPGLDDDKEREDHVAMEEPSFDDVREVKPAVEEPGFDDKEKESSPVIDKPEFDVEEMETTKTLEEPGLDDHKGKEVSPGLEEPAVDQKESSPEEPAVDQKESSPEEPDVGVKDRETSPSLEEPRQDDEEREISPAVAESSFVDRVREESPVCEEARFDEEQREVKDPGTGPHEGDLDQEDDEAGFGVEVETSEQNLASAGDSLQLGVAEDNDLQMGAVPHEEQTGNLEVDEEVSMREEMTELKEDLGERREDEEDDLETDDRAQAEIMTRHSMEPMDESDDEGQDEDEETAEAVDSGDNDNDDFVYEKEVNLEDEELLQASGLRAPSEKQSEETEEIEQQQTETGYMESKQDQATSDTAQGVETGGSLVSDDDLMMKEGHRAETGVDTTGQADSGGEETDSIEGGAADDDKDIDEVLSMQQTYQSNDFAKEEKQDTEMSQGQNLNPFVGVANQDPSISEEGFCDEDVGEPKQEVPAEFDPLAQWGMPTGAPTSASSHDDVDATPEPLSDEDPADVTEPQALGSCQTALAEQQVMDQNEDKEEFGAMSGQKHVTDETLMQPQNQADSLDRGDYKESYAADRSSEADPAEFDPLSEWGHPMGLPSPPPPEISNKTSTPRKAASDTKKPDAKRTASATSKGKTGSEKRPASAPKTSSKSMNGTADTPRSARSKPEVKKSGADTPRSARPASSKSADSPKTESKSRTTPTTARRPPSTKARASPEVIKMPPLPPFTPFHVDLTYIPNHGDLAYVDSEFFKRVRARYYVLSARNPNPKILEMLMDAKGMWDKSNEQEVTVIPTYETQILQHWMMVHKEKLAENKIDIAPAASRCTVRLQDHEDSCYTYRLEF